MQGSDRNDSGMNLGVSNSIFHGNVGDVNSHNINIQVNGAVSDRERRNKIAEWVSPIDFSSFHAQALNKRTPGTLEWRIASPAFMNWRSRRGGFLWCPGPPGAGKTVFAAFVIDQLQKARNENLQAISAVCYIYCQYSNRLSVLQIFEVILRQLILLCPSVEIEEIKLMKDESRRLPLDEIIAILQSSFHRLPSTFVVLDALDECFSEADRHHLLQRMRAFSDVNILMTSRDLPHIVGDMQGVARLDIRAIERDVNTHLDSQRQRNPRFANLAAKLSGPDLTTQVIAKAGHSFLLADLHISYLSDQTNTNNLKLALDTLPTNAAASHASAIGRINQQSEPDKCLAYTVLSLVSYAFRPFRSLELRHAAANLGLDRVVEDNDLADEDRIVSICAGLITVNQLSTEVGFIHYTVQEYLQEIRQTSDFLSQSEITKSLMRLIHSPRVADPPRHPLLNYATSSWPHHVRLCERDESVVEMALSLLADSRHVEILCSEWDPYGRTSYGYRSGVQAVHLVTAFGLTMIGRQFLQRNPQCMDQRDDRGRTPLSWAAGEGHRDTVLMLLDAGSGRSHPLVLKKSLDEVNRLIRRKVQVNTKDERGRTPLSFAAENDHSEVVKVLLDCWKPGINLKDKSGRTPLSYAAARGHLEVVKMLINVGKADLDVKDRDSMTPLSYAAESGNIEAVNMLLETGKVSIDDKDKYGQTPLFYAAKNGHLQVMKLLLDTRKVEVDVKGPDGRTPLSNAAGRGNLEVVKMLLSTGKVAVDPKDTEGRTPLSYAAGKGNLEVVNVLLNTGKVEVDAKDIQGRAPLSYAAGNGHLVVVKMLLDTRKVEIDAKDRYGRAPLSHAAGNGLLEVVKVLLNTGKVNINAKAKWGQTPLSYAAKGSHLEVVKLLLDTGMVETDIKDEDDRTPLSYAAEKGHVEVVKLLLDTGKVEIDQKSKWGRTPLSYAARDGHLEVVKILLDTGKVDVDATDSLGSPITYAKLFRNWDIVKLLEGYRRLRT